MTTREQHARLAEDAFSACVADFAREQGRSMTDDEHGIARRTAELAVEWTATQPLERLLPRDGRSDRKRRRLNKREERQRVRECKQYVKQHWDDPSEGYGFVLALISAVVWHLCVVLIVRFLLKQYFNSPELAAEVCRG